MKTGVRRISLFLVIWAVLAPLSGAAEGTSATLADIVRDIRTTEYHFSDRGDGTFSAPNRAQGLRIFVTGDGLSVAPRVAREGEQPWKVDLDLAAVARGDKRFHPAGHLRHGTSPERVEITGGQITQWFVNERRGLEQGFTIASRPLADQAGPLVLELRLGGTGIEAELGSDGRAIHFRAATGGPVLDYAGLLAYDATRRELPAVIELNDGLVRVVVDDSEAVYPVIVDPTFTNPNWSAESNQDDANFGFGVSSAGDVNCDGRDDVIIGADKFDNGEVDEGRAFVFTGTAFGLNAAPTWTAEGNRTSALFGRTVAAGDFDGDNCGDIVIAAPDYDDGVQTFEGWVFVFHGSGAGLGANGTPANADWSAQGNQIDGGFGAALAAADVNHDGRDDLIVGADEHTNPADPQESEGMVYAFLGSPAGLGPLGTPSNADWTADSDVVESDFGAAVASAGDVNNDGCEDVVVGAPDMSVNFDSEGRISLYLGCSPVGLATTPSTIINGDSNGALLGFSVAGVGDVNGDTFDDLLFGSPSFTGGQLFEGRALLYYGTASGVLGGTPAWTAELDQAEANFGNSVARAGDVNFDGYPDVLVGANFWDNGEVDEGGAFLYMGSPSGLATQPARILELNQESAAVGVSVAGAGDIQNDGFDDILVGADEYSNPQVGINEMNEGAAFALWGCLDTDRDGVCQATDNCPTLFNGDQQDVDGDGTGDLCDPCLDVDHDGVCDEARVLVESSGPGEDVFVQFASLMRYRSNTTLDGGAGLSWTTLGYNDLAWSRGQYGVGYESSIGAENLILTAVNNGSCASLSTCPKSIYTRAEFFIADLAAVESVWIGADYDDGWVAWINGVEVYRSSEMPAGIPAWNTVPAGGECSNGAVPDYGPLQQISGAALGALQTGINVLAVGVWNQSAGSSDLVVVPRLSINRSGDPTVNYLANAVDPQLPTATWTAQGFNDLTWSRGNFGLGYDTQGAANDLIHNAVPSTTVSVFSRAHFEVDLDSVTTVSLSADWDDGYAAWINGVEIHRSPEVPPGPLVWNTNPAAHESSNGTVPNYGSPIDVTPEALPALQDGSNVLAVAAWRNSGNTEDLVIVPRLSLNETNLDNCPTVPNPSQSDLDLDGLGDVCDPDIDADGVANANDNCPTVVNPLQTDSDLDDLGNPCDSCPGDASNDIDGDGICSGTGFSPPKIDDGDNCPTVSNPNQADLDLDGLGDACDPDIDQDGVLNPSDNCPTVANAPQTNDDGDVNGAACDCNDANNQAWAVPTPNDTLRMARTDICFGFTCTESQAACTNDAGCDYDRCAGFACSMSFGACASNEDCDQDTCQGFTCSAGGNGCTSDTNCTADFCGNTECTAGGNPCLQNSDCTADVCANKFCTQGLNPCTSQANCTGGPADVCVGSCSFGGNFCVSDSNCVADVCRGTCAVGLNQCATDAQCTADQCEGTCSLGGNTCVDDSVCTAPQEDLCEGNCSISGGICADDSVCTAPQTDLCRGQCSIGSNVCADQSACTQPPVDTVTWKPSAQQGSTSVGYDTLRSPLASNFVAATVCLDTNATDRLTPDATLPGPGAVLFYLVRTENTCPASSLGTDSDGVPRVGRSCP